MIFFRINNLSIKKNIKFALIKSCTLKKRKNGILKTTNIRCDS